MLCAPSRRPLPFTLDYMIISAYGPLLSGLRYTLAIPVAVAVAISIASAIMAIPVVSKHFWPLKFLALLWDPSC